MFGHLPRFREMGPEIYVTFSDEDSSLSGFSHSRNKMHRTPSQTFLRYHQHRDFNQEQCCVQYRFLLLFLFQQSIGISSVGSPTLHHRLDEQQTTFLCFLFFFPSLFSVVVRCIIGIISWKSERRRKRKRTNLNTEKEGGREGEFMREKCKRVKGRQTD